MYPMIYTRPDNAFAAGRLLHHTGNPTIGIWTWVKRIMQYINETTEAGVAYGGSHGPKNVERFCDADWVSCTQDRKKIKGYVVSASDAAVLLKSIKQPVVTTSTEEAKYLAPGSVALEGLWLCDWISFCNRYGESLSNSTQGWQSSTHKIGQKQCQCK